MSTMTHSLVFVSMFIAAGSLRRLVKTYNRTESGPYIWLRRQLVKFCLLQWQNWGVQNEQIVLLTGFVAFGKICPALPVGKWTVGGDEWRVYHVDVGSNRV